MTSIDEKVSGAKDWKEKISDSVAAAALIAVMAIGVYSAYHYWFETKTMQNTVIMETGGYEHIDFEGIYMYTQGTITVDKHERCILIEDEMLDSLKEGTKLKKLKIEFECMETCDEIVDYELYK